MENGVNKSKPNIVRELYELLDSVVLSAVCVLLVFTFLFRIFIVSGSSMLPTLENNERIIVSDFMYKAKTGDIICFYSRSREEILVKRVIATAGQTVDITSDNRVTVDGIELEEDYLGNVYTLEKTTKLPYTVEQGRVFVMGDNRPDSLDSRYVEIGTISEDDILGKLILRLFPNFGKVD